MISKIKNRLFTGWTFQRFLYLAIGVIILIQGLKDFQWPGILFGTYFTSMGLFAFGCAGNQCHVPLGNAKSNDISEIEFEEIKSK